MDMLRVWPIVCQYGIGAVLCTVGIWGGFKGGYLDLRLGEDRRLVVVLVAGYFLMLGLVSVFTFLAPFWASGGAQ